MELRDYLSIVRKRWIMIVAVTLSALALTAIVTIATTPMYTARTSLFFVVGGSESTSELVQGSTFAQKQVESYAEVATAPYVLEPVIDTLDLDTGVGALAQQIRVTVPTNTVIIEIAVDDTAPQRAADIANAVGSQLASAISELSPSASNGEAVSATTISAATAPEAPSSPNVPRNLALGLVLGLLGGVGVALLLEVLNTKVRTESDIDKVTDASVVATIAYDDDASAHPLTVQVDPRSPRAEAYRRLRTNLQFLDLAGQSRSIVVTSSLPQEGKTTTSINLAIALAEAGTRVLLVDADLRRPQVANYMQLEGRVGLTTLLIGRASLEDVVQPWGNTNLHVLPAGKIPPNPSELLGSHAMEKFVAMATDQYDLVLLDTAPLLPVTDGAILAGKAGGALLVVGSDVVHQAQLADSIESLESVEARLLGLVLNKVQRKHAGKYSSYHYHPTYTSNFDENEHAPRARSTARRAVSPRVPETARVHAVEPTGEPVPMGVGSDPALETSPPTYPPRHATRAARRRA